MEPGVSFRAAIDRDGVVVVPSLLDLGLVSALRLALERAIESEVDYHKSRRYKDYGMVLLCALYDRCFIDLCGHSLLMSYFESILGDGCILYAYTSSSMPPNGLNFSNRVHVDCPRIIPGYVTNVGATIALDDFSEDNGATWYLPGSHNRECPPSDQEFFSNARRFVAPAGSVLFFNARVWHSGGVNKTSHWRHAVTMNMVRPWMKQRLDIPRVLSEINLDGVSEKSLQKLGFHSQPPASYNEYFAPLHQRTFKQGTE